MKGETEWKQCWLSDKGTVVQTIEGWVGRVYLPQGKVGRLGETFESAPVAMRMVEERWKREHDN